jgi:hypothetical protein
MGQISPMWGRRIRRRLMSTVCYNILSGSSSSTGYKIQAHQDPVQLQVLAVAEVDFQEAVVDLCDVWVIPNRQVEAGHSGHRAQCDCGRGCSRCRPTGCLMATLAPAHGCPLIRQFFAVETDDHIIPPTIVAFNKSHKFLSLSLHYFSSLHTYFLL